MNCQEEYNELFVVKNIQRFICETCEKEFNTYRSLSNHKRTHGTDQYCCDECNKVFKNKIALGNHKRSHNENNTISVQYKTCEDCNRTISISNFNNHKCDKKQYLFSISDDCKISDNEWKCSECDKIYKTKQALASHYHYGHTEKGKTDREKLTALFETGVCAWSKGLTKDDPRVNQYTETRKKNYQAGLVKNYFNDLKELSKEEQKEIKSTWKKRHKTIDYTLKSGEVVQLESNYEIWVATSLEHNNIRWVRPKSFTWFDDNGKAHQYTADFYLLDYDVYLDPKNDFLIEKEMTKIKIERTCRFNNIRVIVLNLQELSWVHIKRKIDEMNLNNLICSISRSKKENSTDWYFTK